jgi:hypothetical protein
LADPRAAGAEPLRLLARPLHADTCVADPFPDRCSNGRPHGDAIARGGQSQLAQNAYTSAVRITLPVSGRGERMRADGPLHWRVRCHGVRLPRTSTSGANR